MTSIQSKVHWLLHNSCFWALVVAALCIVLTVPVCKSSMTTMSPASNYPELGKASLGTQQLLLAFPGGLEETGKTLYADITVDGERSIVKVNGTTVAEALASANILLGPNDSVTPPLEQTLDQYEEVTVVRREQVTVTRDVELPYRTVYVYSPTVRPGEEVVEAEGQNGRGVETYAQMVSRGEVVEEKLIGREVFTEPVNKRILMGFRVRPVSTLDFSAGYDENGEPLDYTQVFRGQKAAGYSAAPGAGTASGLPAKVGHVAVNPKLIPYGSKLYIQSSDGKFIYGYAIAADTGGALMKGHIGVDLFYNSYEESVANGIREVDIFVLE